MMGETALGVKQDPRYLQGKSRRVVQFAKGVIISGPGGCVPLNLREF